MPTKDIKAFEKEVLEVINDFVPALFLQMCTWEVQKLPPEKTSLYECQYNYPYLNVAISYSNNAFEEWKAGKDQKPYILHEMCHVITDPFYSKAVSRYVGKEDLEDERERLTDLICNIVLKK